MEHSNEARVDVVEKETEKESRNIAVLVWVGTLFLSFLPSLIVYFVAKDPYAKAHAKEALNVSIMLMIGYIIGAITVAILIGVLILFVVSICHLVFCIMGAIKAYQGGEYRAPFIIRAIR
jgi:hypothetical protein